MSTVELSVKGMSCGSCVLHVTEALNAVEGVTEVDVTGIATDYCVRASARDAIEHGLHVRILTDLVAGVAADSSQAALAELAHAGAELVTADAE